MLAAECREAGVEIFLDEKILKVRGEGGFLVKTASAEFAAPALVVATGGLSIPKMGATSFGYDLARQFGLKILPTRPALVPLLLDSKTRSSYRDLAGVSAPVAASTADQSFRESMLFTHRGLSGPAILQISSYWKPGQLIHIDLAPDEQVTSDLLRTTSRNSAAARCALQSVLPRRLAQRWLEANPPPDWTNESILKWERNIHAWSVTPSGTEGYEKAEVTAGGVDTAELSSKTLQSRKVKGLFFIGEVVDVTGHLGGFNFQWAWSSAHAAGLALAS